MSIEAMKQALEALEEVQGHMNTSDWFNERVDALRTAIEAAEKQEHATAIETCPYDTSPATDYWIEGWKARAALEQAERQEPVMIYHGGCDIDCGEHGHHNVEILKMIPAGSKLFTTPPAAQRQPLTDEQIWKFWLSRPAVDDGDMESQFVAAVRDVLAAYGITGEKK